LGKITERVEIVHFIADIKERMFGIVAGGRRADDHSGGILAVAGNVVRSGCVAAEGSEIGDSVSKLALSVCKPNQTNAYRKKTDFYFHRGIE
jgi:hypothetical protein